MDYTDSIQTLGIVGLKYQGMVFGRKLHQMGFDLKGADVSPSARTEFGSRFDATTYENLEQLLESDIDAVIVASPNKYHTQPTIKALRNGYNVLVEKPLAQDLDHARQIAEVEEEVEPSCMVGFHFRFLAAYQVLRDFVHDGFFGDIYHIEARQIRRRGIPGRGSWYTSKDIAGGGAVVDIGVHSIDLILDLFDWPTVNDMMSVTRTKFGHLEDYTYQHMHGEEGKPHRFDVEDSASALLQMEGDQTASMELGWAANTPSSHEYYIYGTDGGAYLDLADASFDSTGHSSPDTLTGDVTFFDARETSSAYFVDMDVGIERKDPYEEQFNAFFEMIEDGSPPLRNSTEEAIRVQEVIEEFYQ